jgi:hypothetical protein
MTAVPDLMVTLATGTQVPWSEFKTWSAQRQGRSLVPYVVSDETRARSSAANKGKTVSAETRAKRSAALKGRKRTAEARAKASVSLRGKPKSVGGRVSIAQSNQARFSKPIMTPTGVFPSLKSASEWAVANGLVNARQKILAWLVTHPDQFYYVPKDTK